MTGVIRNAAVNRLNLSNIATTSLNGLVGDVTLVSNDSSITITPIGQTINLETSGGGGAGTVTTVTSSPNDGVTINITNPTTTPNLTIDLGTITPDGINTGTVIADFVAADGISNTALTTNTLVYGDSSKELASVTLSTGIFLSGNTLSLANITPASVAAVGTVTGSNLSGTNTGDQNLFSKLSVTGQSDITANTTTTTLTVAGTGGITVTTNAGTRTLTIDASASGFVPYTGATANVDLGVNFNLAALQLRSRFLTANQLVAGNTLGILVSVGTQNGLAYNGTDLTLPNLSTGQIVSSTLTGDTLMYADSSKQVKSVTLSSAFSLVSGTLSLATVSFANGGTGNTITFTANSIPFSDGSKFVQDNANLSYTVGTTTLAANNLTVGNLYKQGSAYYQYTALVTAQTVSKYSFPITKPANWVSFGLKVMLDGVASNAGGDGYAFWEGRAIEENSVGAGIAFSIVKYVNIAAKIAVYYTGINSTSGTLDVYIDPVDAGGATTASSLIVEFMSSKAFTVGAPTITSPGSITENTSTYVTQNTLFGGSFAINSSSQFNYNAVTSMFSLGQTTAPSITTQAVIASSTQNSARLVLSGQEFGTAGNTSTDGIGFLLYINRSNNRQLCIGDSANMAVNGTNTLIRIAPDSKSIDCITTNGTTSPMFIGVDKDLTLNQSGGKVAIGNITPTSILHVYNASSQEPLAHFQSGGDCSIRVNGQGGEAYAEFMNNATTTSNAWKIGVNDSVNLELSYGTSGTANSSFVAMCSTASNCFVGFGGSAGAFAPRSLVELFNTAPVLSITNNNFKGSARTSIIDFVVGGDASERTTAVARIAGIDTFSGGSFIGDLAFYSLNSNVLTEGARLNSSSNFGVGTSTQAARIESLWTSGPQLRLTYTNASVYTNFTTNSSGNMNIIPTGGAMSMTTNNTATGVTNGFTIEQSGTGDAVLQYLRSATRVMVGIDATDSQFKETFSTDLGTTPFRTVTTAGEITLPLQPCFFAWNSTLRPDVTGNGTVYTLICNTEVTDQNADYDNTTGVFTSPRTGKCDFSVGIFFSGVLAGHTSFIITLITSNATYQLLAGNAGNMRDGSSNLIINASIDAVDMDAADTAYITAVIGGSTLVVDIPSTARNTFFSGALRC